MPFFTSTQKRRIWVPMFAVKKVEEIPGREDQARIVYDFEVVASPTENPLSRHVTVEYHNAVHYDDVLGTLDEVVSAFSRDTQ